MISREDSPAQWAMFMYELEDAKEHLEQLISKLSTENRLDESDL